MDTYCRSRKRTCRLIVASLRRPLKWKDHGALDYKECAGDDLNVEMGVPFPKQMKLKPGETLVFSYVVFKSRAHRDSVNAKVMSDPRVAKMCDPKKLPFDSKRMVYGGFKVLVDG